MIYQIFLRTFTNEGTLTAAEKLLPHVKSLGTDYVYLCPTFVQDDDPDPKYWSGNQKRCGLNNPCNPYRIKDYYHVDPEYGTDDDLRHFVKAVHGLGMKVMFDLVYFHCGPTAVFLDEHPDFILRKEDGTPVIGDWSFPQLNYGNPELREYMWQNMEYLVREFDCDGYRCDVADLVPIDFWIEGRRRVKVIKDDFIMLIEGLYEPRWREAYDLIYEFWLSASMKKVLEGAEPAAYIAGRRKEYEEKYIYGGTTLLNWENHDYASGTWTKRPDKTFGRAATDTMLFLLYTMRGEPFLYAGNEIADGNVHSIYANRFHGGNMTIDWQNILTEDGQARLALVKRLDELRRANRPLSEGSMTFVDTDAPSVLAFVRACDGLKLTAAVNMSGEVVTCAIDGVTEDLLLDRGAALAADGRLSLEPYGFAVIQGK
ncbi:MAG: hypothetical protein IJ493_01915 [Clostridia bacterium]|nr:hypothetical protein [Clostridia bacterium]